MRNSIHLSMLGVAAAALILCPAFLSITRADQPQGTSAATQAQSGTQAKPEIEKQRQEAEQQARGSLDKEAVAAIDETRNAVKAINNGRNDEAMAAIERAIGRINVLLARNPSTALLPVDAQVMVIDAAPTDVKAIRQIAKAAERAVDDKDYPGARVLLRRLTSEIRVRTYNLPLGTYPVALAEAARLLDQKRPTDASAVLTTALDTLVAIDRVIPLPLVVAQAAIDAAQVQRDTDKNAAQALLAVARTELERAKELGYAGKDPEYTALHQEVSDLEKQLKGTSDTASAFTRLKERIGSFFRRLTGSQKGSEVASK